jgi:transcriptional regulator with XRE-family HTH domain
MDRPDRITTTYRGIAHTLDLARCRRALVDRQVEGRLDTMEALASAAGISRSTVSRFFSGRRTSLAVTLRILHVLGLPFEAAAQAADSTS